MGTEVLVKLQNNVLTRTFAPEDQVASNVYSTISSFQFQTGAGAVTFSSVRCVENRVPVEI